MRPKRKARERMSAERGRVKGVEQTSCWPPRSCASALRPNDPTKGQSRARNFRTTLSTESEAAASLGTGACGSARGTRAVGVRIKRDGIGPFERSGTAWVPVVRTSAAYRRDTTGASDETAAAFTNETRRVERRKGQWVRMP